MTLTPELAFGLIGTVTGTISLLISWSTWRSDRSKFRIEACFSLTQSIDIPQWHFQLTATLKNHGRRSIKIRELGLILEENKWEEANGHRIRLESSRIQPFNLSKNHLELAEGDRRDFCMEPFNLQLLTKARQRNDRSIVVYAIDSLDNEHRINAQIPDEKSIKFLEQPMENTCITQQENQLVKSGESTSTNERSI